MLFLKLPETAACILQIMLMLKLPKLSLGVLPFTDSPVIMKSSIELLIYITFMSIQT